MLNLKDVVIIKNKGKVNYYENTNHYIVSFDLISHEATEEICSEIYSDIDCLFGLYSGSYIIHKGTKEIAENKYLTGVKLKIYGNNLNDVLVRMIIAIKGLLLGFKASNVIKEVHVTNITGKKMINEEEVKKHLSADDFISLHEKATIISNLGGNCYIHFCK